MTLMKKPKESAVDKLKNIFIIIDDAHSFFCTLPAQVMLPYCPNYGLFGKYGLYSESKLEKLLDGWYAESWGSKQVFMFCINMLISQGSIITPELRISPAQSFAITVCGSAQFTPTGKGIIDKACNIWKKIIAD